MNYWRISLGYSQGIFSMSLFWTGFIMLEVLNEGLPKLICYHAQAFFKISHEGTLKTAAVVIIKSSDALPLAIFPLAFVDSLNCFGLCFVLEPKIGTHTFRDIFFPFPIVLFVRGEPAHHTPSFFFIGFPWPLILITRRISHFSKAFP